MKWVTWENVGIDRMGSAWLIGRTPRLVDLRPAGPDVQRAKFILKTFR